MNDTKDNRLECEKHNFTWESNNLKLESDNSEPISDNASDVPDNCLAGCVAWWGFVGAAAAAVACAPATAMICVGISITGLGVHLVNMRSCDDCIPNEFPHQD